MDSRDNDLIYEKKISLSAFYFFWGVFVSFLLLLIPKNILKKYTCRLLLQRYSPKIRSIIFYKSGRSALTAVFEAISKHDPYSIALLPDYICNVVYKSAAFTRLNIQTYRTDKSFKPDLDQLELLLENKKICIILFASIFGGQNNGLELLKRVRAVRPDIFIVFDECQNLITDSPVQLDNKSVIVLSFNKTLQGVMGGALCFDDNSLGIQPLPVMFKKQFAQEIFMLGILVKQIYAWIYRLFLKPIYHQPTYFVPAFEYTFGNKDYYGVDIQEIAKISLVRAIIGLVQIQRFESQRRANYFVLKNLMEKMKFGTLIETDNISAIYTPFLLHDDYILGKVPLKGPYAKEQDPTSSFRPDSFCFINDGQKSYRMAR